MEWQISATAKWPKQSFSGKGGSVGNGPCPVRPVLGMLQVVPERKGATVNR